MYLRVVLRFSIKTKTVEHILYFAIEDWWVLDIDSFVSGKDIEAIYSSTGRFCYSHNELRKQLYHDIPRVEKLFRIMNQKHWQQRNCG
jgi:hypothetical protein